jgi:two-component system NtrC family response regulator
MASILIIDDDKSLCGTLCRLFQHMAHDATYALTLAEGVKAVSAGTFDVVYLDVHLPDGNGLEALPTIQRVASLPEVVIVTGGGDPDGAELAIKSGAWDYMEKPPSMDELTLQLARLLRYRREKLEKKPALILKRKEVIGSSPQLEACLELVAQTAGSDLSVLITGETGTGKEIFAKAIHGNSHRADKQFVVVDCASLPETLVGSMLFGHEKGAFTGAGKSRVGLIKEADRGTLFLDEVGELPLAVQKDFLRVLQENRLRPLGSNKEIESDFRLVSATNRDLEGMVQSGQFRKDLFFRLRSATITLPPLRIRLQDIKDLTLHYMVKLCERYGIETKGFSSDFFEALVSYNWPGNVRELIHTVERVLATAIHEPTLFARHLPTHIRVHKARALADKTKTAVEKQKRSAQSFPILAPLQEVREAALAKTEERYLQDLMEVTRGSIKEAGRISGLSRSRLYNLLNKYKIDRV